MGGRKTRTQISKGVLVETHSLGILRMPMCVAFLLLLLAHGSQARSFIACYFIWFCFVYEFYCSFYSLS